MLTIKNYESLGGPERNIILQMTNSTEAMKMTLAEIIEFTNDLHEDTRIRFVNWLTKHLHLQQAVLIRITRTSTESVLRVLGVKQDKEFILPYRFSDHAPWSILIQK